MANELSPIDSTAVPGLQRLAEEVRRTGKPRRVQHGQEDIARLVPVTRPRQVRRGRPTNAADPLWTIIGIGRSTGPTDVSANKHTYLAEAYADTHDRPDTV